MKKEQKFLRERANDILLSNKICGGIVGVLPIIDYFIQKSFIKKNAAKKAGQIFGIDIKFIEDEKEESRESVITLMGHDEEAIELNMELNGEEIVELNGGTKSLYLKKAVSQGFLYIKEGTMFRGLNCDDNKNVIGGVVNDKNVNSYLKKSIYQELSKFGGRIINKVGNIGLKSCSNVATTVSKFIGIGCIIGGAIIGVTYGGYLTVSYCEELLDRFEDYYKKNANKISNSYNEAKNYFILDYVEQ